MAKAHGDLLVVMKIYAVRIGDRYGPEYEDYLNEKLSKYRIIWIREPFKPNIKLQWNKMLPMSQTSKEPVCVMDIDVILQGDYEELFDYPVERGQFLGIEAWWKDHPDYTINGGFFKYHPIDCNYIFDKFMKDPEYWQRHYIENGTTVGPVNGEQHFVEDSVRERLELITAPASWVSRWSSGYNMTDVEINQWHVEINRKYCNASGNEYLNLGGEFHPDVKMIHYTHAQNKPY